MKAQVGDWARCYRDGHLVLGVVQYTRTTISGSVEYLTDCGVMPEDDILEVRSHRSEENFKHPTGKAALTGAMVRVALDAANADHLIAEQENK